MNPMRKHTVDKTDDKMVSYIQISDARVTDVTSADRRADSISIISDCRGFVIRTERETYVAWRRAVEVY